MSGEEGLHHRKYPSGLGTGRYCIQHQGDNAHYAFENCRVCQLEADIVANERGQEIEALSARVKDMELVIRSQKDEIAKLRRRGKSIRERVVERINRLGYCLMGVK